MKARTAGILVAAILGAGTVVSYVAGSAIDRLTGTLMLRRPLADAIPAELDGWRSTEEPLTESLLATTRLDDHVRRHYVSPSGERVTLYVAYQGNKERGMQTYYHNVEVCFPSQGWTNVSKTTGTETSPLVAREIPVCRYVFEKGGTRLSVLTFFEVDGEPLDQSPRNKPFWMLVDRATPQFSDSPGTFVQVQVVVEVPSSGEHRASELQSRFLRTFGHSIIKAIEDVRE